MDLIYLAHPVRPLPGSPRTVEANLASAEWWLAHLQRANPEVAIVAPWLQSLRLGVDDDGNPTRRRQGLARAVAATKRCDGIILCGPRISSGMLAELLGLRRDGIVHRFRSRHQPALLAPATRCASLDQWGTPLAFHDHRYGSVPLSPEETAREAIAAFEEVGGEAEA